MIRRQWAIVRSRGNDEPPFFIAWAWTEASAWRTARRALRRNGGRHALWLDQDGAWLEVRHRGEHATPMGVLLEAELDRILEEGR